MEGDAEDAGGCPTQVTAPMVMSHHKGLITYLVEEAVLSNLCP